jgi:hypothetical protein
LQRSHVEKGNGANSGRFDLEDEKKLLFWRARSSPVDGDFCLQA